MKSKLFAIAILLIAVVSSTAIPVEKTDVEYSVHDTWLVQGDNIYSHLVFDRYSHNQDSDAVQNEQLNFEGSINPADDWQALVMPGKEFNGVLGYRLNDNEILWFNALIIYQDEDDLYHIELSMESSEAQNLLNNMQNVEAVVIRTNEGLEFSGRAAFNQMR